MDEMYLKMILALPDEFFDGWEWKHCDYGINLDNIEKGRVIPLEEMFHTEFKILYVDSFFKDIEWILKDRVRPIPSQEQLQKLSGLDWDLYYHDLVKNYSEYDSAEQAGLAMIMYMKYGKMWDGEHWEILK